MLVTKNNVVTINYTLSDDEGNILDTSEGREPLSYLHGVGALISGLESALEGKTDGDSFSVSIPPEDGYGEWDEHLVQSMPANSFGEQKIEVGMEVEVQTSEGLQVFTVIDLENDNVILDGNHPLANVTLNFDLMVLNVRAATPEELNHGHVH